MARSGLWLDQSYGSIRIYGWIRERETAVGFSRPIFSVIRLPWEFGPLRFRPPLALKAVLPGYGLANRCSISVFRVQRPKKCKLYTIYTEFVGGPAILIANQFKN
jgi:hypothetical protein